MKMSFNTTTSSATTPSRSADAGVNASVSKGAPETGTARNLLFSLPAPAQRTVASDAALAQDLAADLTDDGAPATDVAADITQAATTQDAGLPAMTPPLMAPMLPIAPQADAAAAAAAKGNDGLAATQQGNAQQTLDLNSRLHPDGLAFNVQTPGWRLHAIWANRWRQPSQHQPLRPAAKPRRQPPASMRRRP